MDSSIEPQLDRVIARCEADLQTPDIFEGSGALISWRRATAVRLSLRGASDDEIFADTGLSGSRAARIIDNFTSHGVAALSPSFEERCPRQLSAHQKRRIRAAAGSGKPRVTMAALADRAVAEGIVTDLSHQTLSAAFPLWRRPWTPKPHHVVGPVSEVVVGIVAAVFCVLTLPLLAFPPMVVVPILCAVSAVSLIGRGVQGLWLRRRLRKLAGLTALAPPLPLSAEPSREAPPVEILNAITMPDPVGAAPALNGDVAYLWVFDAPEVQDAVFTGGWVQLAPTRLLTNVEVLTAKARRRAARRGTRTLIADEQQLHQLLQRLPSEFGSQPSPTLNLPWRPRRFEGYPLSLLVCTAGMWHAAFDALLGRAGLVVCNLSGFEQDHPGLAHELRHVLLPPSPAYEVFVLDATTDADAAIEFVTQTAVEVGSTAPIVFVRTPRSNSHQMSLSGFIEQFRRWWRGDTSDDTPLAERIHAYLCSQ